MDSIKAAGTDQRRIVRLGMRLGAEPPVDKGAAAPASLEQLRSEQVEVLTHASEISAKQYNAGLISFSEMNNCMKALTEAKLDASKTARERAEILAASVAAAKLAETLADAKFKAGLATELEHLEARSYRLKLQIMEAGEQRH